MDKRIPRELDIVVQHHDDIVVVAVAGEVDMRTASQLDRALHSVIEQGPATVIVDLSGVGFLASAGLGVLAAAHTGAETGPVLRIVAHSTATLRPLQVTGLDRLFDVYPSLADALAGSA